MRTLNTTTMNQESTENKNNHQNQSKRDGYDFFADKNYNTADLYPTSHSNFLQFLIMFRFKVAISLSLPFVLLILGFFKSAIAFFCIISLVSFVAFKYFKKAEKHINKIINLGKDMKIRLFALIGSF